MRIVSVAIAATAFLDLYQANAKCTALRRNADRCQHHGEWEREYQCMAAENGLLDIMRCVSIERGAETHFCREKQDGSTASQENYVQYEGDDWLGQDKICTTPRKALLSMSRNVCVHCGMTGILKHCPMNDPNFLECLCDWNVSDQQLSCLSSCFNKNFKPPKCSNGFTKRHVARLGARAGAGTTYDSTSWMQNDGLIFRVFSNGQVEYTLQDGSTRTSPYILPYTDHPYKDIGCSYGAVNRCYISPVSNDKYCWAWCLRGDDYTPPPEPTYGRFTETVQAAEQSKTLEYASHTPSSISFERIEVPTQSFEENESEDRQEKNGSTGCQSVSLSLAIMGFVLTITILALN